MNILSSVKPVDLNREANRHWFMFLIFLMISIIFGLLTYYTYVNLLQKEGKLKQLSLDYQIQDSLYNYSIREYETFYSTPLSDENKFIVDMKVMELKNLAFQNKISLNAMNQQITEYNNGFSKNVLQLIILFLVTFFFGYIGIVKLAFVINAQNANNRYSCNCQSCGRLLNGTLMNYGTNKHGDFNYSFCTRCYQNGKFVFPDLLLEDILEEAKKEMTEKEYKPKVIDRKIKMISNLERWKHASRY